MQQLAKAMFDETEAMCVLSMWLVSRSNWLVLSHPLIRDLHQRRWQCNVSLWNHDSSWENEGLMVMRASCEESLQCVRSRIFLAVFQNLQCIRSRIYHSCITVRNISVICSVWYVDILLLCILAPHESMRAMRAAVRSHLQWKENPVGQPWGVKEPL